MDIGLNNRNTFEHKDLKDVKVGLTNTNETQASGSVPNHVMMKDESYMQQKCEDIFMLTT